MIHLHEHDVKYLAVYLQWENLSKSFMEAIGVPSHVAWVNLIANVFPILHDALQFDVTLKCSQFVKQNSNTVAGDVTIQGGDVWHGVKLWLREVDEEREGLGHPIPVQRGVDGLQVGELLLQQQRVAGDLCDASSEVRHVRGLLCVIIVAAGEAHVKVPGRLRIRSHTKHCAGDLNLDAGVNIENNLLESFLLREGFCWNHISLGHQASHDGIPVISIDVTISAEDGLGQYEGARVEGVRPGDRLTGRGAGAALEQDLGVSTGADIHIVKLLT